MAALTDTKLRKTQRPPVYIVVGLYV